MYNPAQSQTDWVWSTSNESTQAIGVHDSVNEHPLFRKRFIIHKLGHNADKPSAGGKLFVRTLFLTKQVLKTH